ncbi:MAG: hypothetical protein KDJ33_08370 [Gammaproteobacteria bacterium]|nr:hypothetical protein [Gammaproteobacteria bacterium]
MTAGREQRAVAFVVARLSSSRLPGKQLRRVGSKSIIEWIMHSLAACAELDQIVLATVAEPENEPLRTLAEANGWACFWYAGEVDDVVGRLVSAATEYAADVCLLISADCPLVHGPSVDELVRQMRSLPEADCLVMPAGDAGACLLQGVQIARRSAWQAAADASDRPELREHQFPVLYRDRARFRHVPVTLDRSVYGAYHRLSVDTWADLEFMQALHDRLAGQGQPFALPHANALLTAEPALRALNAHVHQRALVESPRRVLMIVDAGGQFGFGHLMRCRELAGQLVERLGWPVTFVVDDATAADLVRETGFRLLWGAISRQPSGPPPADIDCADSAALARHDFVLVDVSVRRTLQTGWRDSLATGVPVVVMDREDGAVAEADLIVYPGVSGRTRVRGPGGPAVIEGIEHVILRREVRRAQSAVVVKDIDLLVYLYDRAASRAIEGLGRHRGWRVVVSEGFDRAFATTMARSRVFLSGFGQSFYEAVALSSYPVVWPLSAAHAADADAFYRAFGMPPTQITEIDDAARLLSPLIEQGLPDIPGIVDGTPRIAARLAVLAGDPQ